MNESEQKVLIESLKSTLEKTENRLAAIEQREKRYSTRSLIAWLLVLAIIAAGVYVSIPKLKAASKTLSQADLLINSIAGTLENVDLERLSANLAVLGNADTEKLQNFVNTAGKIDFKTLGEQLDSISQFGEKLTKFADSLPEFNMDSLTGEGGVLSGILNPFKDLFKG